MITALSEKLRNVDNKYIATKTNSYIPIKLRPANWGILSDSIADYIDSLK
jgi:hypothetical protein